MAWARRSGNCDLYVYQSNSGWVCNSCDLQESGDFIAANFKLMFWHLLSHRIARHKMPPLDDFVDYAHPDG